VTTATLRDDSVRILTGLIGRGIQASRTPRMHEAEADAQGLRLVYSLFDFSERGLDSSRLPDLLDAVELAGFAGVNITHPFKQTVVDHLDSLSPEAERIGAVNTVAFRNGDRLGYNTDTSGFARAFDDTFGTVRHDRVVLVGAGGAGAAVANALLECGVKQLTLSDIDPRRAASLAARLGPHFPGATLTVGGNVAQELAAADGVVNATPVGMSGHPGTAVPLERLRPGLWVAEIVYFPLQTELLAAARTTGCRTMDGSAMAVYQAAGAFEIFTGSPADAYRMRETFRGFDCP
jgi:shikimate dehydrogenase